MKKEKKPITKKTKRIIIICIAAAFVIATPGILYGLALAGLRPPSGGYDKQFSQTIAAQTCWDNTLESRYPATSLYNIMMEHILQVPSEGEGAKKLLFIGYDGALATAMGEQFQAEGSTAAALAAQGGLWLTRTGGANPGSQRSETAPGWTSIFTGVWADVHGVQKNGNTLKESVRTAMYQAREVGKQVTFAYSWSPHGTQTYKLEAADYPEMFSDNSNDEGTVAAMLQAIEQGQDFVLGTLEHTDHAGHSTGYSLKNKSYMEAIAQSEADAARLAAAAQQRMETLGEDWMIIITTDHGGFMLQHYDDTLMETTTFVACNKKIF